MDPRKLFADERLTGFCVYCGGAPSTRDHVPSKVLLDEPFPPNLPVVEACHPCNNGFSLDEQYLACLLDCVLNGSTNPESVSRNKVKRLLQENEALAARIAGSCSRQDSGDLLWAIEVQRVRNVLLKLARGHVAYEYSEPHLEDPEYFTFAPLCTMTPEQVEEFETITVEGVWPEIGSRAFLRTVVVGNEAFTPEDGWQVVQEGRYRYAMSLVDGVSVRMVLGEYLACQVIW